MCEQAGGIHLKKVSRGAELLATETGCSLEEAERLAVTVVELPDDVTRAKLCWLLHGFDDI